MVATAPLSLGRIPSRATLCFTRMIPMQVSWEAGTGMESCSLSIVPAVMITWSLQPVRNSLPLASQCIMRTKTERIFSVFLGGSFAVLFLLLNNDLQSIQSDSGLKRFQSRCPIRYIFLEKYNQSVIESKNLTCQVKCFTIKYEHQLLMI